MCTRQVEDILVRLLMQCGKLTRTPPTPPGHETNQILLSCQCGGVRYVIYVLFIALGTTKHWCCKS